MSGHSKFANIRAKKEKNDAAKGKIFTRIGKEIMVAVKEGGPDVNNNSKLKSVVAKAKANNMPNDTIERSIKKAASSSEADLETIRYEGYGPAGVAIIVEALTDNRNRAASNIRHAFTRGGGNIGTPGCVSFLFTEKGQIIVAKEDCDKDGDAMMEFALEAGAEDLNEEDDSFEIITDPDSFNDVEEAFEKEGIPMASAEVTMIPSTTVKLTNAEDIANMNKILETLDEDDDVQNVWHNWEEE
ncbi:MAG: YebC/PmpR family DNA-binding transcriptional regulator [Lachnospiraceae bacterium]|jgi:YebC/PmpR family DNA-binding regulatory protein